ncbi:putative zinc metalloprotease [Yarrowia lipolytica]|uniref:Peptide hydrolase n=1 Tax=Yarrowia lipolytica TaxID=4952 RepID=A0A371C1C9_YARLL|nr:Vacuolar membrane protease [Yarrowia lipolytica]RDW24138.1 putative zinc metalloprotease [Yarrowia lipolytica]RDW35078.1 putative zinc metalloprotease [Yarrowia lipolytica]RDW44334.1 putative zinc metalloprotease [Yarrowia lipolytica]RDW51149.1 putative zinc metalloprotease [Yarrowia lipolytica]
MDRQSLRTTLRAMDASNENGSAKGAKKTTIGSFVRWTFGFNSVPLTTLVTITTVLLGLLVYVSTSVNPPDVTEAQKPLLNYAWAQLGEISRYPHPYFSHDNDRVRQHILKEVYTLAGREHFEGAQIEVDDSQTDIFIQKEDVFDKSAPPGKLTYFEGNNVVVRLSSKNSDKSLGAILLSAHFDSVPSSFGVTDDGAGIATMLAVLKHALAQNEGPKRDIIFNFNNNEEFGLLGAEAFMHHPWAQNVSAFINLEGTGAGGKAILFRASDYGVASHYSAAEMPFASSVYQEGFSNGFIHSQTDYKVYTEGGLRGLDIAFYKPRALYHTRRDNIAETTKNALNHMLVNTIDVTQSMTEADSFDHADQPAVFSDIGGYLFIILPLQYIFVISCLTLAVGPIFVGFLFLLVLRKQINAGTSETILGGWLRSIVSVLVSVVATYFVVETLHLGNELYVVRSFYTPLFAGLGTFIFVNYVLLGFFHFVRPVCDQKLIILLELSVVLWALLLLSVIHEATHKATGEYHFLILYIVVATASILGLFGHLVTSTETSTFVEGPEDEEDTVDASEATETSPLLPEASPDNAAPSIHGAVDPENQQEDKTLQKIAVSMGYDWSIQFLLVVPITFFVTFGLAASLLDGLHQTPLESEKSADFVYTTITAMSVLIGITFLPFVHKLQVFVPIVVVGVAVTASFVHILSPPFSSNAPAKMRFVQNINLDEGTSYANVLGRQDVLQEVLEYIPSTDTFKPNCSSRGDGVEICNYIAPRPWLIDGEKVSSDGDFAGLPTNLLDVKVVPVNETSSGPFDRFDGRFKISALNNRGCVLRFNTTRFKSGDVETGVSPVKMVTLRHNRVGKTGITTGSGSRFSMFGWTRDPKTGKDEFRSFMHGVDDVTLHKLDWEDPEYDIQLSWIPRWYEVGDPEDEGNEALKNRLGVTVTCSWAEYLDPSSIVDEQGRRRTMDKIPAFTELNNFSPAWSIWSNQGRGLVEVSKYVEL